MYAVAGSEFVPTKLNRITIALEPELYEALQAYSSRSRRSMSNQISVIIEQALIATGDLKVPIARVEKRGGKRPNAGRKPSNTELTENDDLSSSEKREADE
ncbi:MAG: hypothetical protein KME18_16690 [Phormidium tanganyikae FI6-MK23]|jgi:hypothetical protein|nr:hypothetical protein [Phormidium tanganyikae FI6-MK23]